MMADIIGQLNITYLNPEKWALSKNFAEYISMRVDCIST